MIPFVNLTEYFYAISWNAFSVSPQELFFAFFQKNFWGFSTIPFGHILKIYKMFLFGSVANPWDFWVIFWSFFCESIFHGDLPESSSWFLFRSFFLKILLSWNSPQVLSQNSLGAPCANLIKVPFWNLSGVLSRDYSRVLFGIFPEVFYMNLLEVFLRILQEFILRIFQNFFSGNASGVPGHMPRLNAWIIPQSKKKTSGRVPD